VSEGRKLEAPEGVVLRKVGGRSLLMAIHLNSGSKETLFSLNETGEFVWRLLDGTRAFEEVVAAIVNEYDVDEATARADLSDFLDQARSLGRARTQRAEEGARR
jgi:hypothetical protein